MNLPINLHSIGYASQQLQTPVQRILATANALAVVPSHINGVIHFEESDFERIRVAIALELRQRESAVHNQRSNIM